MQTGDSKLILALFAGELHASRGSTTSNAESLEFDVNTKTGSVVCKYCSDRGYPVVRDRICDRVLGISLLRNLVSCVCDFDYEPHQKRCGGRVNS